MPMTAGDRVLASFIAMRLAAGDTIEDMEKLQRGKGFTFEMSADGGTRWFTWKVENVKAKNWGAVKGAALTAEADGIPAGMHGMVVG